MYMYIHVHVLLFFNLTLTLFIYYIFNCPSLYMYITMYMYMYIAFSLLMSIFLFSFLVVFVWFLVLLRKVLGTYRTGSMQLLSMLKILIHTNMSLECRYMHITHIFKFLQFSLFFSGSPKLLCFTKYRGRGGQKAERRWAASGTQSEGILYIS